MTMGEQSRKVRQDRRSRPEAQGLPSYISSLMVRFPRLKRQLHPWLAHFPITFMLSATFFSLLYLWTRVASFKATAWYCLAGGVLFLPGAIFSGLLTEKINYPEAPPSARIEKIISLLLSVVSLTAFIWSLVYPDILDNLQGVNLIYLFLILALAPLVIAVGFFGGMLTFPLEEERPPGNGGRDILAPKPERDQI